MKLIYQFLDLTYCFLFFRYLEKVFKEEINKNKEGNSLVINLVILNFELTSTFLYALCELFISYS